MRLIDHLSHLAPILDALAGREKQCAETSWVQIFTVRIREQDLQAGEGAEVSTGASYRLPCPGDDIADGRLLICVHPKRSEWERSLVCRTFHLLMSGFSSPIPSCLAGDYPFTSLVHHISYAPDEDVVLGPAHHRTCDLVPPTTTLIVAPRHVHRDPCYVGRQAHRHSLGMNPACLLRLDSPTLPPPSDHALSYVL